MNLRTPFALLLGIWGLVLASTCSFSQEAARTPTTPGASYPRKPITIGAQVFSLHKIQVAAQADGIVDQLLADEGHTVKKGDTLLIIDNRVAAAELNVAKKEWEAAAKQAKQTAEVEYAKKAAEVSDAEYEESYLLYNQGSETYSAARRKQLEKERARLGIDVAKVKHEQEILVADVNEEKVKASQIKLDLYKVIAPYDGVIVERLRDQGEWIRSGEPVLRLMHMNEMKVEAMVPIEGISIAELQGAPINIQVQISPQDVATFADSRVEIVSPEISMGQVRVSTRIQNQLLGGVWLLRDGMNAKVVINPQ